MENFSLVIPSNICIQDFEAYKCIMETAKEGMIRFVEEHSEEDDSYDSLYGFFARQDRLFARQVHVNYMFDEYYELGDLMLEFHEILQDCEGEHDTAYYSIPVSGCCITWDANNAICVVTKEGEA